MPRLLPPATEAALATFPAHVRPRPARTWISSRPTCPRCGARCRLHVPFHYVECGACALVLWLKPAQTWLLADILAGIVRPTVSVPALLAEIALEQLGVTPVGVPR